jgi:hypothetical protein
MHVVGRYRYDIATMSCATWVVKVSTEDGEITRHMHRIGLLQAVNSSSHVLAAETSTVDIEIARGEDGAANSTGRQ